MEFNFMQTVVFANGLAKYVDRLEAEKAKLEEEKAALLSKVAQLDKEVKRLDERHNRAKDRNPDHRVERLEKDLKKAVERGEYYADKCHKLARGPQAVQDAMRADLVTEMEDEEASRFLQWEDQKKVEVEEARFEGKYEGYATGWEAGSSPVFQIYMGSQSLYNLVLKSARQAKTAYLANFKRVVREHHADMDFSIMRFAYHGELPKELIHEEEAVLPREKVERMMAEESDSSDDKEEGECSHLNKFPFPREVADELCQCFTSGFTEYKRVLECIKNIDSRVDRSEDEEEKPSSDLRAKKKAKRQ